MFVENFHTLTTWSERAPQNKNVLKTLDEYFQKRLKYDHLKVKNLSYRRLYFSPAYKRLQDTHKQDTEYSDLTGTVSSFNCLYLGHSFSDRAQIC